MKIKQIVCDILDREGKGYVTIGDVGKGIFVIFTLIVVLYLLYCGVAIWRAIIECPYTMEPFVMYDFSIFEKMGYGISLVLISCSIIGIGWILMYSVRSITKIKLATYRKEKGKNENTGNNR